MLSSSPCVGDGTGLFPFCVSHQSSSFHCAFKERAQVCFLLTPQAHSFHRYSLCSLLTCSCSLQSSEKTVHWLSLPSKVKELGRAGGVLRGLLPSSPSLSRSSGRRSPSFLFSDIPTASVSLAHRVGYCVLYISHTRALSRSCMCAHVGRLQCGNSGGAAGRARGERPCGLAHSG